MIDRAVDKRMRAFYEAVREKPTSVLVSRKDAARIIGVSLPTLDRYGKYGILHPKRRGGSVLYAEAELRAFASASSRSLLSTIDQGMNISPLPNRSHSQETP